MKKGIVCLILSILASLALSATDKELALRPDRRPDQALTDWSFDNAVLVKGFKGGRDLAIASASYQQDSSTDLLLHFDSADEKPFGDYALDASPAYAVTEGKLGAGAGLFTGRESALSLKPGASALFSQDSEFRDFSIEFWLDPADVRDGESVFLWKSSRWSGKKLKNQEISCNLLKGKAVWTLTNLFKALDDRETSIILKGRSYLVPKAWSHQALRFDFGTGLVEYLMDGQVEATAYATSTGHEGGTVSIPATGNRGELRLGHDYAGLMDELRVSRLYVDKPVLDVYSSSGARAESPIVDLGFQGSLVTGIDAVCSVSSSQGMEFLARCGNSYADWDQDYPAWRAFSPGRALPKNFAGRYFQVACNLYPDGPGRSSPRLSEIKLLYREDLPPPPPARVLAAPLDGEILLSWTRAPDANLKGYRVYYGESKGEYFGTEASLGKSPVDVGDVTSVRLSGLANGKLYYIAVAAYGPGGAGQESEFSPEVTARPLRVSK